MGKAHYYQKVINSQPPLIFVLGAPVSELLQRISIDCSCAKRDDFVSKRRRKPL